MWIIKPETPEWKRTLKNINPNAVTVFIVGLLVLYFGIEVISAISN